MSPYGEGVGYCTVSTYCNAGGAGVGNGYFKYCYQVAVNKSANYFPAVSYSPGYGD